jgi:hypothetical protein
MATVDRPCMVRKQSVAASYMSENSAVLATGKHCMGFADSYSSLSQ